MSQIDNEIEYDVFEVRGGIGNKVIYSTTYNNSLNIGYSKGTVEDKIEASNFNTLKEYREAKMIEYINEDTEQEISNVVNTVAEIKKKEIKQEFVLNYRKRIKHRILIFIMKHINNEQLFDNLTNMIRRDIYNK